MEARISLDTCFFCELRLLQQVATAIGAEPINDHQHVCAVGVLCAFIYARATRCSNSHPRAGTASAPTVHAGATPDVSFRSQEPAINFVTELPSDSDATAADAIPAVAQARRHAREHYDAAQLQLRSGNRKQV